jgi:putative redox protein
MAFEASTPSGNVLVMDGYPDDGKSSLGPTPVEAFLSSIAACSAMDVVSILLKMRQDVTGYRVEIDGERIPPGEWPRPFLSIEVKHILIGHKLDGASVEKAVRLSDEKYCSVMATLRQKPEIINTWEIEDA